MRNDAVAPSVAPARLSNVPHSGPNIAPPAKPNITPGTKKTVPIEFTHAPARECNLELLVFLWHGQNKLFDYRLRD